MRLLFTSWPFINQSPTSSPTSLNIQERRCFLRCDLKKKNYKKNPTTNKTKTEPCGCFMPPILHTAFKANQPRQRSFSAGLHLGGCGGESGAIVKKFLIFISPVITAPRTRLSTYSDSERLRRRWPSRFPRAKNGQPLAAHRRHVSCDASPLASVELPARAAA